MRLPRLGPVAMIVGVAMLSACSSGGHSQRPPIPSETSTSTSTSTSTTSVPATTTSATGGPTSLPSPTSSASAPGGPGIISLTGPPVPVQCNAPTSVELRWETRGATTVTLRIDGGPVFATYADGPNDKLVPLACDGKPHSYTLTARAADGRITTKTLRLTERAL